MLETLPASPIQRPGVTDPARCHAAAPIGALILDMVTAIGPMQLHPSALYSLTDGPGAVC